MEVKVFVNGLPRVVCGLTKDTTCQEVVIALAQALGQPGRYILRETFKDFQRCMAPTERVLETLDRYGELSREVQLTLILNGPAGSDPMCSRFQPRPPPRRGGARVRRGSTSPSLRRRSLPALHEQQIEDVKRTKRKSLTIMEEAWEWLENLGRGKVYRTTSEKDVCKKREKKNRASFEVTFCKHKTNVVRSELENQTSCCIGSQPKARECRSSEAEVQDLTSLVMEDEKQRLIENILSQKSSLDDLKMQIAVVDRQIFDIEERRRLQKAEEEAKQKEIEEELEQVMFWENELAAEEGHERELQSQFLEIKDNVAESKAQLEELKLKIHGLDFGGTQAHCSSDVESRKWLSSAGDVCGRVAPNRMSRPRGDGRPPHALVAPCQIKERRPTGPSELREWWARWAQAQKSPAQNRVVHRTEVTIYLRSTKV